MAMQVPWSDQSRVLQSIRIEKKTAVMHELGYIILYLVRSLVMVVLIIINYLLPNEETRVRKIPTNVLLDQVDGINVKGNP